MLPRSGLLWQLEEAPCPPGGSQHLLCFFLFFKYIFIFYKVHFENLLTSCYEGGCLARAGLDLTGSPLLAVGAEDPRGHFPRYWGKYFTSQRGESC